MNESSYKNCQISFATAIKGLEKKIEELKSNLVLAQIYLKEHEGVTYEDGFEAKADYDETLRQVKILESTLKYRELSLARTLERSKEANPRTDETLMDSFSSKIIERCIRETL